jgi:DNA-binding NtrC family response regulator
VARLRIDRLGKFLKDYQLPDPDVLIIGRTQGSDIVLPDEHRRVSRNHAALVRMSRQPIRYFIRDLGSVHGTKVNGVPTYQRVLSEGDVVEIADYHLTMSSQRELTARASRIRVVPGSADEPLAESSTMALHLKPDTRDFTPEQCELLQQLQHKRGSSWDSITGYLAAVLHAVRADRGFWGGLRRDDAETMHEWGSFNLGEGEVVEISEPSFPKLLLEGDTILESRTVLVPVRMSPEEVDFLCVNRRHAGLSFSQEDLDFLEAVASTLRAGANDESSIGSPSVDEPEPFEWPIELVGRSKAMLDMLRELETAVASQTNVLVLGATGSGKEVVARMFHQKSADARGPLVSKNCGKTTETLAETEIFGYSPQSGISGANPRGSAGWFEQANGGTLFLDEVHGLSISMQDQLLRVLQDKKVWRVGATTPVDTNVNVIAATDKDLPKAIEEGSFREPLFFRFGATVNVPSLQERQDDIPLLAYFFLDRYAHQLRSCARTISRAGMKTLMEYNWPGNVRQIENVMRAAVSKNREVIFSWDIQEQLSPLSSPDPSKHHESRDIEESQPRSRQSAPKSMDEVEKKQIREVLEVTRGNITKAAEILGYKSRQTILNKMDRYGIPRNYANPEARQ